ncbi:hypothetical protein [Prosthecochloris sp. HL-130-GSB]|uniref:hypothetical protein n=1 Tax=Prosthecochloris sp. HL-130-GSB TaxID=1974213 RepID=UPI0018DCC73B|nr:hypothetical protein [Prosthecochloris sp. HL-130-GSB]
MNTRPQRLTILVAIVLATLSASAWWAYSAYVSPTKVAIVSFPGFMVEKMQRANANSWVHIEQLDLEELDKLQNYPFALIRGHGVRISPNSSISSERLPAKAQKYSSPTLTTRNTN